MKKIFVLIACLALILCTAGVAGVELSGETIDSGTTTVTYVVQQYYVLQVPASVTVTSTAGRITQLHLSVTNAVLEEDQRVNVTISSANYDNYAVENENGFWRLKNDNSYIHYHIHTNPGNEHVHNESTVLYANMIQFVDNGNSYSAGAILNLSSNGHVTGTLRAGNYQDSLVFTAKVEDNPNYPNP